MLHEVVVVALEEVGGVEVVGAFVTALSTTEALLDLLHLLVEFVGEVDAVGGAAEEEVHAVAALDLDACGAGLAVAAATAEVAAEFLTVFLNAGAHVVGEDGRVVLEGDEFVELAFALDAPDGFDMGELGEVGIGGGGMVDESARKAFHGDEADVVFLALLDKGKLFVGCQVGEGELEGFIKAAVDGLLRHGEAVVGDADMADFALLAGLEHGFVKAGAVAGQGTEGGVVELVEVDVVGAQQTETGFEVAPETVDSGGPGLGADDYVVTTVGKGCAEFFLTVGVEPGGVEVVEAVVEGFAEEVRAVGNGDALDGKGTEAVLGDNEAGFA